MVADDSSLEIENLSATVSSNAVDKVEAIIYVNTGRLTVDSFTTPASVTGLAIGPNATASQISITDSNIGKIAIDETNKDTGIYDEITNGNTSDAEITTGFDATTAEEFGNALKQFGRVRLMADFSIENDDIKVDANTASSELELNGEEYIIDLNTHTINSNVCWYLLSNTIVRISNGSLNFDIEYDTEHDPLSESTIILYEEAELYFDNVHFFSNITGLFMKDKQSGMVLDIRNSEIKAAGYYAIGTNANTPPHSQNLTLNIINSTVTTAEEDGAIGELSNYGDNSAILFNVQGNVTITDSTLKGDRHALVARGGTYVLTDSSFEATQENNVDHTLYLNTNWKTGTEVPSAAIVFGNRSTSYAYPTKATLENVTTIVPDMENVFDIYVYQADPTSGEDRSVSVTGTVSNEVKVNEGKMNNAHYDVNW